MTTNEFTMDIELSKNEPNLDYLRTQGIELEELLDFETKRNQAFFEFKRDYPLRELNIIIYKLDKERKDYIKEDTKTYEKQYDDLLKSDSPFFKRKIILTKQKLAEEYLKSEPTYLENYDWLEYSMIEYVKNRSIEDLIIYDLLQ